MPLDLLPYGRDPVVFGTSADSPRLPHARFLPPPFPAAECTRLLCHVTLPYQTTLPEGCTRLAAVRFSAKCEDMFVPVSDFPHICFLFDLLQLLLLLPLLPSWSAHGHAVRIKSPFRYGQRGCPRLYSHRGASADDVRPSVRGDTALPACSYAFTIGKFRRWWYSSPLCSAFCGWQLIPAGLPLCPALDAGLHLNQVLETARPCFNILAHETAPQLTLRVL